MYAHAGKSLCLARSAHKQDKVRAVALRATARPGAGTRYELGTADGLKLAPGGAPKKR